MATILDNKIPALLTFTKTPWYRSLLWKLLIILMIIGFLPIFFFSTTIINSVEDYFLEQRLRQLSHTATLIASRVTIFLDGGYHFDPHRLADLHEEVVQRSLDADLRVLILENRGVVVTDSQDMMIGTIPAAPEVITALRTQGPVSVIQANGINRYTLQPVFNPLGDIVALVFLISSVQDINELVDAVGQQAGLLNILTASFAAVIAIAVSIIILSPLKRLLKVVERMQDGHLNERVAITGNDEFTELCKAFNEMNDKLESIEQTREEFVSNVSHELKTPLSSIKVLSESILFQESVPEGTYREFLEDITSEVNRMDHIINDLLTLVKLDQTTAFINLADVDLVKLLRDIIRRLTPIGTQKNITLIFEPTKDILIKGDDMKLTLAISNLIENGIKYTPNGGTVTITAESDHQNAFLTVTDTGIGIAEEEQSKIFTRFYRVDKTRDRDTGGTGLGLSITHTTILHHKGSIRVNSKEGEGTTFSVRLPLHQHKEATDVS